MIYGYLETYTHTFSVSLFLWLLEFGAKASHPIYYSVFGSKELKMKPSLIY